jgi:hypothetical protein
VSRQTTALSKRSQELSIDIHCQGLKALFADQPEVVKSQNAQSKTPHRQRRLFDKKRSNGSVQHKNSLNDFSFNQSSILGPRENWPFV